jgi:hypothetical protein
LTLNAGDFQDKQKGASSFGALFESKWLPERSFLLNNDPIISITYKLSRAKKTAPKKKAVRSRKHIIHKAIEWRKMLDEGVVGLLSEIAKKEGRFSHRDQNLYILLLKIIRGNPLF